MYKKTKVVVTKTFGNEELQKLLRKILKSNLGQSPITESNNLRGEN